MRAGLIDVEDLQVFLTAVNMAYALPRDEVVRAIQTRIGMLEDLLARRPIASTRSSRPWTPPTRPARSPRLLSRAVRADIAWAHEYLGRLRSGAYAFDGEPPDVDADARAGRDRAAGRRRPGRPARRGARARCGRHVIVKVDE